MVPKPFHSRRRVYRVTRKTNREIGYHFHTRCGIRENISCVSWSARYLSARDPARGPSDFCPNLIGPRSRPMNIPNEPLSNAEIHVLDEFLMSDRTPEDVLSIDELHGYLTAIVCSPVPVMPSDWLEGVWQTEEGPEFESAEQAQELMALIMRMYNDIDDALRVGEEFGPLMLENTLESGETVVVAQGWCGGFMEGMRARFDAWEPHLDMTNELVVPIAVLARLGDDDAELRELLDDKEKIAELTGAIAESSAAIYDYSRSIADRPSQPFRRQTAKVGRNDPCPCGSGKKYKKCCGASGSLH